MLSELVPVLTRPTYSSMSLGLLPAHFTVVGLSIRFGLCALETEHAVGFHGQPNSIGGRGENRVLGAKICFRDPTGAGTQTSDEDVDLL